MTRKHYSAIAEILDKHEETIYKVALINELSVYLKSENPMFSEELFKQACYKRVGGLR